MQIRQVAASLVTFGFLLATGFGQSLGDVARAQRQKQTAKPATAQHKVITDEDIPASAEDAAAKTPASENGKTEAPINSASNGEELKAKCLEAKQQIKEYQDQLDKLRASIQFVEANRYSNGVEYNQHQLRKQQEADRMEKQLDQARKRFSDLQERARKAGFGSSVYDP